MNIDAFWQANRKFIIGLVAGIIAFFSLVAVVAGGATDRFSTASISVSRAKRAGSNASQYSVAQVRELEGILTRLDADVTELTNAALPSYRKRFQVPVGVSPASHYIALTGELRDELIGWALRHNVNVDETLGLPPVSPSQPLAIEQHLRALDVVDRVVHLAIDNGASEIDKIRISQQRRVRSGKKTSPLLITPLSLEITFARVSVTPFLRAMMISQQGGNSLGVVSLEVLPPNQKKSEQRIVIDFEIAVLPQVTKELE